MKLFMILVLFISLVGCNEVIEVSELPSNAREEINLLATDHFKDFATTIPQKLTVAGGLWGARKSTGSASLTFQGVQPSRDGLEMPVFELGVNQSKYNLYLSRVLIDGCKVTNILLYYNERDFNESNFLRTVFLNYNNKRKTMKTSYMMTDGSALNGAKLKISENSLRIFSDFVHSLNKEISESGYCEKNDKRSVQSL